ncbi:hypothetical protein C8R47DRAFT_1212726 [Mycena vitilis]|nr:hypothetical protein C8R47DRAFT_1212726 [Mycena vitilis]
MSGRNKSSETKAPQRSALWYLPSGSGQKHTTIMKGAVDRRKLKELETEKHALKEALSSMEHENIRLKEENARLNKKNAELKKAVSELNDAPPNHRVNSDEGIVDGLREHATSTGEPENGKTLSLNIETKAGRDHTSRHRLEEMYDGDDEEDERDADEVNRDLVGDQFLRHGVLDVDETSQCFGDEASPRQATYFMELIDDDQSPVGLADTPYDTKKRGNETSSTLVASSNQGEYNVQPSLPDAHFPFADDDTMFCPNNGIESDAPQSQPFGSAGASTTGSFFKESNSDAEFLGTTFGSDVKKEQNTTSSVSEAPLNQGEYTVTPSLADTLEAPFPLSGDDARVSPDNGIKLDVPQSQLFNTVRACRVTDTMGSHFRESISDDIDPSQNGTPQTPSTFSAGDAWVSFDKDVEMDPRQAAYFKELTSNDLSPSAGEPFSVDAMPFVPKAAFTFVALPAANEACVSQNQNLDRPELRDPPHLGSRFHFKSEREEETHVNPYRISTPWLDRPFPQPPPPGSRPMRPLAKASDQVKINVIEAATANPFTSIVLLRVAPCRRYVKRAFKISLDEWLNLWEGERHHNYYHNHQRPRLCMQPFLCLDVTLQRTRAPHWILGGGGAPQGVWFSIVSISAAIARFSVLHGTGALTAVMVECLPAVSS